MPAADARHPEANNGLAVMVLCGVQGLLLAAAGLMVGLAAVATAQGHRLLEEQAAVAALMLLVDHSAARYVARKWREC